MMNRRYSLIRSRQMRRNSSGVELSKGLLSDQTYCSNLDWTCDRMTRRRSSASTTGSAAKTATNKLKSNELISSRLQKKIILTTSLVLIVVLIVIEYKSELQNIFVKYLSTNHSRGDSLTSDTGGWRLADLEIKKQYDSNICNIDKKWAHELTSSEFEKTYRHKRPVIVSFRNGAKDWTDPSKWTVDSLKKEYGEWAVLYGNALDIVRRGGSGYEETSFSKYVDKLMGDSDVIGEPFYVFDRDFYNDSSLPSTLKPPSYFQIKDGVDDSIFFLGSSGSGVSFHKHADAWNGVIYGFKRWFLYMSDKTPPGGVYPGFTQREWFESVYPKLSPEDKPLECVQGPGEILYLPEGTYHATINIGDTVAIGIQKKEAVTKIEKLFYDERKLVESMHNKNEKERLELLKRKQTVTEAILQEIPGNAEIQMKSGSMYVEVGDLKKAKEHMQKAIDLDQYFIIAILNLAGIEQKLGNSDEAERLYQHAQQLNTNLWDVYAQYGDFLLALGRAHDAVEIYRKGTEIQPTLLPFWVQLQHAQKASGDYEGARDTQKKIDQLITQKG